MAVDDSEQDRNSINNMNPGGWRLSSANFEEIKEEEDIEGVDDY